MPPFSGTGPWGSRRRRIPAVNDTDLSRGVGSTSISSNGRTMTLDQPPLVSTPYVSDADALYAEWSVAGDVGNLRTPYDTPYGLREFSLIDSEGTLHRVGSPQSR